VEIDNSFGWLSSQIQTNGLFISEGNPVILYPSGNHLAKYDIANNIHEFVTRHKDHRGVITAVTNGLTRKSETVIALAEANHTNFNTTLSVSVYMWDRMQWFHLPHKQLNDMNDRGNMHNAGHAFSDSENIPEVKL